MEDERGVRGLVGPAGVLPEVGRVNTINDMFIVLLLLIIIMIMISIRISISDSIVITTMINIVFIIVSCVMSILVLPLLVVL